MLAIGSSSPVRAEQPPSEIRLPRCHLRKCCGFTRQARAKQKVPAPATDPRHDQQVRAVRTAARKCDRCLCTRRAVGSGSVRLGVAALFRKDAALRLTKLPQIQNGVLTVVDGMLVFMTDKPGTYSFDVGFLLSGHKSKVQGAVPTCSTLPQRSRC